MRILQRLREDLRVLELDRRPWNDASGCVQIARIASMYSSVSGARFFQSTWKTSNSLDDCVAFEPSPTPTISRPFVRWSSVAVCFAA